MNVEDRLAKLFERGGISFSVETIETRMGAQVLITITRSNGSNQDTVGGTYTNIDEGINDCIDKLDRMQRERTIRLVKDNEYN